MAERGAELLLSLICLTFLHPLTMAVHLDKGNVHTKMNSCLTVITLLVLIQY